MESVRDEKLKLAIDLILSWKIKEDIDDTLIQKFLSFMEDGKVNFGIFDSPEIEGKLHKLSETYTNPHAISFAFQLGSILLSKNPNIQLLNLIEAAEVNSFIPVVRDSYWKYLTTFSQIESLNPKWFKDNIDLVVVALDSLNDESLFVRRSVEGFTIAFTKHLDEKELCHVVVKLVEGLLKPDFKEGCINSLHGTLYPLALDQLRNLNDKFSIIETLLKILHDTKKSETICKILALFSTKSFETYLNIQEKLLGKEKFLEMVSFTYFALERIECGDFDLQPLLDMLILPVKLFANKVEANLPLSHLEKSILLCMADKAMSRSILVKCFLCQSKLVAKFDSKTKLILLDHALIFILTMMDIRADMKNHKLLNSALELILQLVKSIEFEFEDDKVLTLLLKLLDDSSLISSLFHSCASIVSVIFERLEHRNSNQFEDTFWIKLGEVLSRRTLDKQWEIRDSALEIIHNASKIAKGNVNFSKWVLGFNFHGLIWDLVSQEEAESYIRATSLSLLVTFSKDPACWQALQDEKGANLEEVSSLLSNLLTNDPEAFVQRAAVDAIRDLFKHKIFDYNHQSVFDAILWAGCFSLDWEVKMKVLSIWEEWLQKHLLSHEEQDEITNDLIKCGKIGLLDSLLLLLEDCDRPVQLQSGRLIKTFVDHLNRAGYKLPVPISNGAQPKHSPEAKASLEIEPQCEASTVKETGAQVIESVLDMEMKNMISYLVKPKSGNLNYKFETMKHGDWTISTNKLCEIDTTKIIIDATKSTDVYEDDLEAILDDIIAAAHFQETCSDSESQITDCY